MVHNVLRPLILMGLLLLAVGLFGCAVTVLLVLR